MPNPNSEKLAQDLRAWLSQQLGLPGHKRTENSFWLEALELVPEDKIKSEIVTFLANEGYHMDTRHEGNVLIFNQSICWGWVTISNFSGQEPLMIIISVTEAPSRRKV